MVQAQQRFILQAIMQCLLKRLNTRTVHIFIQLLVVIQKYLHQDTLLVQLLQVSGKAEPADVELIDDRKTREALAARNTANIYNILFVGCDIH